MSWSRFASTVIFIFCAVPFCAGAIRFELPDVTATSNGSTPTSGFFDVLVRANPGDLPQSVTSYNLDFQVTSASVTLGPPGIAPNSLFNSSIFSNPPNPQTIRAAQDSSAVSLFDGAALVRVPFQVPAGVTGAFTLAFGDFNQLADANAASLPLQTTDTGIVTISSGFPLGDYNHNGSVGTEDYTTWRTSFGSTSALNADGNGNSVVDAADYVIWRNQSSPGSSASAELSAINTPEPSILQFVYVIVLVSFLSYTRYSRRCFSQLGANN
jgi:hypothetical protein